MYNDNRVLLENGQLSEQPGAPNLKPAPVLTATGMLSQPLHPVQPGSQPGKITFSVPQAEKPAGNKVFVDKTQAESDRRYQEQQQQQANQGKIICTRLHELGYMSDEDYKYDLIYGRMLCKHYPSTMAWYLSWAPWFTRKMHHKTMPSKIFCYLIWALFARSWTKEMAYRIGGLGNGSLYGRFLMYLLCVAFTYMTKKGKKLKEVPDIFSLVRSRIDNQTKEEVNA